MRTLRGKLMAAFGIVSLLSLVIGLAGLFAIHQVVAPYQEMKEVNLKGAMALNEVMDHVFKHRQIVLRLGLEPDERVRRESITDVGRREAMMTDALERYTELMAGKGQDELVGQLERAINAYVAASAPMVEAAEAQDMARVQDLANRTMMQFNMMDRAIAELNDATQLQVAEAEELADGILQAANLGIPTVTAIVILVGTLFSIMMSRQIVRPIRGLMAAMAQVAEGDLRLEPVAPTLKVKDEVRDMARAFDQMVGSLRQLIESVSQSTGQVLAGGEELTAASVASAQASQGTAQAVSRVTEGATEQSRLVAEVTETTGQLDAAIQQLAAGAASSAEEVQGAAHLIGQMLQRLEQVGESAVTVAERSAQSAETAHGGAEVVDRALAGMGRIQGAVTDSAQHMRRLAEISEQIGAITETIGGISEQTNLLALNAAIEAARAGEHGRGFAVVAEEVRSLAERSAKAAQEITALITTVQGQTQTVVVTMEQGMREVEVGSQLSSEVNVALREILQVAERSAAEAERMKLAIGQLQGQAESVNSSFAAVAAMAEENTAATEEMAANVAQVTQAMGRIAEVSQENAAVAEEVSASTEEQTANAEQVAEASHQMTEVAEQLRAQVLRFQV